MFMNTVPEDVNVLVIEDDEIDVEVLRRAFRKNNINNSIYRAKSGVDALEMMRGAKAQERLPKPYILLVDINMPEMDGLEFLNEVRNDNDLKKSIAFILTTSARDTDVARAYDLNAAGYFLKDNMQELINMFSVYKSINQFPNGGELPH
ncbi:MAG: response regulator [Alphaproteobacteria bacterium]|nr:response regulator [Alphaproteobacteria bacterium]